MTSITGMSNNINQVEASLFREDNVSGKKESSIKNNFRLKTLCLRIVIKWNAFPQWWVSQYEKCNEVEHTPTV